MFSNVLTAKSKATYVLHLRLCIMMIKHKDVLLLLTNLSIDTAVAKPLSITHVNDWCSYISPDKYILLMNQDTATSVINDYKFAVFHANAHYRHIRALRDELHDRHLDWDEEQIPTFSLSLETKIYEKRTATKLFFCSPLLCVFTTTTQRIGRNIKR